MSDRDALLAAIREAPRDDAPRLIYADWLDEHGEPDVAEFIRVQIELEPFRRLDGDLDRWRRAVVDLHLNDPVPAEFPPEWWRYAELARREREIYEAHRWEWLGELGMLEGEHDAHFDVRFRRGFAEEVSLATSKFVSDAALVRSACPMLRRLTLYGPRDQVADVAALSALNGIAELELAGWITAYDARFLASSFALRSVESLTLWIGSREDPEVIRTLARPPWDGGPSGATRAIPAGPHLLKLRDVVLVQLNGGMRANDPHGRLDRRAEGLAGEFNRILGRAVACVEQPWARRFPLAAEVGFDLRAGHIRGQPCLQGGTQAQVLLRFDAAGRLVAEDAIAFDDTIEWPASPEGFQRKLTEVLRRDYGFVPGPIFVREFASEAADLQVYLYGVYEDVIEDPDSRTDGDDHEEVCAVLNHYSTRSDDFVVLYEGSDLTARADGTIHET